MTYKEFLDSLPVIPYNSKWEIILPNPIGRNFSGYISIPKEEMVTFNIPDPKDQILTFIDWIKIEEPKPGETWLGVNLYIDQVRLSGTRAAMRSLDELFDTAIMVIREGGRPDIVLCNKHNDLTGKILNVSDWKEKQGYIFGEAIPAIMSTELKPNEFMILMKESWLYMEKDGFKTLVCSNPGWNLIGTING